MIPPLTHIATPPGDVPTGNTPPDAGRDTCAKAIARALNQPVRVIPMDEEEGRALLVEPLHFHAVVGRAGRKVISQSHVSLNSLGGQSEHVAR